MIQSEQVTSTLDPPIGSLGGAGRLVGLAVVAAAGAFWTSRRRLELRQATAGGTSPSVLGMRAVIEAVPAVAAGAVAGWWGGWAMVRWVGPSSLISADAISASRHDVVVWTVAALLLLGLAVGVGAAGQAVAPSRLRAAMARAPWEALPLVLAGAAYYEVRIRGTSTVAAAGPAKVDTLVLLFPLLLLAGGAGVAARLVQAGFRSVSHRLRAWPFPAYLAARRIASASRVASLLVASAAVAVGVLIFAGSLAGSIDAAVGAKAATFVGSDVVTEVGGGVRGLPPHPPGPVTLVERIGSGVLTVPPGGSVPEVLTIDPATFPAAVRWQPSFSPRALPDLVGLLRPRTDLRLSAILVGGDGPLDTLQIGQQFLAVRLAAQIDAFPGASAGRPTLVVDRVAWRRVLRAAKVSSSSLEASNEVWARGSPQPILAWLRRGGVAVIRDVTATEVLGSPTFLALRWTFGFLQGLGVLAAAISLVGMVLYLQARQRSREVAWALARRMGFSRTAGRASLACELGILLLVAYVVGATLATAAASLVLSRLDPIPALAPTLLLRVPALLLLVTAAGLVASALLGALQASWVAERRNVAQVMRIAG